MKSADYSSVLADLIARRDKLNAAIQAIQDISGDKPKPASGEYRGMTIAEATLKFLQKSGEPQLTRDIAEALKAGGLGSNAKSLYRTIYNSLQTRKDKQKDIVKVGSKWSIPNA